MSREWFLQRYIDVMQKNFSALINGGNRAENGVGTEIQLYIVDIDKSVVDPVTGTEIIERVFKEPITLRCGIVPKSDDVTYNEIGANVTEAHIFYFDALVFDRLGIVDTNHVNFPKYLNEHFIKWNGDFYKIIRSMRRGEMQNISAIVFIVVDSNPVTK